MARPLLTEDEIADRLSRLPLWRREGDTIVRTARAASFPAAIALVGEVAAAAEEADHHPDIDIRYTSLRFALTTHDSGGLTVHDMDMAERIDTAVADAAERADAEAAAGGPPA
ncbi:4a-hydroxytetrahydrobiopterin dehydratase [Allonocardiopsis opalescens]|uniref:Putative pterin-4-alpha-carbinolamine dehydratase n=1 Tax=Allonocardiopsis opalescens TaxID=1144618 RepID=A0A2T0PUG7_9ACTN|nr:4a-hydroxytetrahydrobiopterin dehydratase [Allonocardiopsis opalescens]PRX92547.1 pterin-4-alpha-carbinolamine dehydratase [Allonocardiopsis opalescens]